MYLIFKLIEYSREISFWFGFLDWLVRTPEAKIQAVVMIEKNILCERIVDKTYHLYN